MRRFGFRFHIRLSVLLASVLAFAALTACFVGAVNVREYSLHFRGDGCIALDPHDCTYVRIDEYQGLRWLFHARVEWRNPLGWTRVGPWTAVAADEHGDVLRVYRTAVVRDAICGLGASEIRAETVTIRGSDSDAEFRRYLLDSDVKYAVGLLQASRERGK